MNDDGVDFLVDLEQRLREIVVDGSQPVELSQAARETALDCLKPRHYGDGQSSPGVLLPGLITVAQRYRSALSDGSLRICGYQQLGDELMELKVAVDELASKFKDITAEAAMWIEYPEIEGDSRNARIRFLADRSGFGSDITMQARGESCQMVVRLEAFSALLHLLVEQAVEEKIQAPPGKQYLPSLRDSPAFLLFHGCGRELLARGYSLKHLRPIAAAIHEWATDSGTPVSLRWEQRAEYDARALLQACDKEKNKK